MDGLTKIVKRLIVVNNFIRLLCHSLSRVES